MFAILAEGSSVGRSMASTKAQTEAPSYLGGSEASFVQGEKVFAMLPDDDNNEEWHPGTISKVNAESGRVEYTVKWDDCRKDADAEWEEETDGFSFAELTERNL